MNTINDHWTSYRSAVVSAGAGEVQLRETHMAFYGGAAAVLDIVLRLSEDDVSEEQGVAIMERLCQELELFQQDVLGPIQ